MFGMSRIDMLQCGDTDAMHVYAKLKMMFKS